MAATVEQFAVFLSDYGYSVTGDNTVLLNKANKYIESFELSENTPETVIADAQLYAALSYGNGFDDTTQIDEYSLTAKGLGSGAITKAWEKNSDVSGSSKLARFKRGIPAAYDLLEPYFIKPGGMMGFN